MIKSFLAAVQFITLIPAGRAAVYQPRRMIAWFPAVGLLLGFLLAVFDSAVCRLFTGAAAPAVLDVILLVILTGALHIDGLADSADGLFGHRDRETVLSIMKDSRIGVMGLSAVLCCLGIKFAGISGISTQHGWERFMVLLLVPGFARSSMIFGVRLLPYGRPGGGTGFDLFSSPIELKDFWGLSVCIILSLLLGWQGIRILLAFFAFTASAVAYYRRRMGCITGDMLGAMTEASESLLLLAAAAGA